MSLLWSIGNVWAGFPGSIKLCGAGTAVDIRCLTREHYICLCVHGGFRIIDKEQPPQWDTWALASVVF